MELKRYFSPLTPFCQLHFSAFRFRPSTGPFGPLFSSVKCRHCTFGIQCSSSCYSRVENLQKLSIRAFYAFISFAFLQSIEKIAKQKGTKTLELLAMEMKTFKKLMQYSLQAKLIKRRHTTGEDFFRVC